MLCLAGMKGLLLTELTLTLIFRVFLNTADEALMSNGFGRLDLKFLFYSEKSPKVKFYCSPRVGVFIDRKLDLNSVSLRILLFLSSKIN